MNRAGIIAAVLVIFPAGESMSAAPPRLALSGEWGISPTTASYEQFVTWSNAVSSPASLSEISYMHSQLEGILSKEEKKSLNSIDIVWEGDQISRDCADVRQLAYTTYNADSTRAVIRLCLRTIMYLGDLHRAIIYFGMPLLLGKASAKSVEREVQTYYEYLKSVIDADVLTGVPYAQFCTAELTLFAIKTKALTTAQCSNQDVLRRQLGPFRKWFDSGAGWPPEVIREYGKLRPEIINTRLLMHTFFMEYFRGAQSAMIYSVILHEMGHIQNCDLGSLGDWKCDSQVQDESPVAMAKREIAADNWALGRLSNIIKRQSSKSDSTNRFADLDFGRDAMGWIMINRIFAAVVFRDRSAAILDRIQGQAESYVKSLDGAKTNLGEMSPIFEHAARNFYNHEQKRKNTKGN